MEAEKKNNNENFNEETTITKKELARKLKISHTTLHNWLNKRYYVQMQKLGYQKNQRVLLPAQAKFLFTHLDVS